MPMSPEQQAQLNAFLGVLADAIIGKIGPMIQGAGQGAGPVEVIARDEDNNRVRKVTTHAQLMQDLIDVMGDVNDLMIDQLEMYEQDALKKHKRRRKKS